MARISKIAITAGLVALSTILGACANTGAAPDRPAAQMAWVKAMAISIREHWVRPANNEQSFFCKVGLQLQPTGEVTKVELLQSCGSEALDQSVIGAIRRASPLPQPSRLDAFASPITITFRP